MEASSSSSTAPKKKKWGGRTQWSRAFFTMIPSGTAQSDAATHVAVVMKPKKQQKMDELAPSTRWRCQRCGQMLHPPLDPHTRRPCLTVLADHLEGKQVRRVAESDSNNKDNNSEDDLPACTATPLLAFGSTEAAEEAACDRPDRKRSRDETVDTSAVQSCVKEDDDAVAARAALQALFFPPSETSSLPASSSSSSSSPRVFIVVENPKTPRNLGSILRAMHNYGCDVGNPAGAVIYSGTRLNKALSFATSDALVTDTVEGAKHIPRVSLPSLQILFDVLASHATHTRQQGASSSHAKTSLVGCPLIKIVAVDLIEGATCLPFFHHPFPAATSSSGASWSCGHAPLVLYLFGPEDGTISECFLRQCHEAVFMPTIASMNLAASVSVLLYDRIAKACLALDETGAEDGQGPTHYQRVFATRNANNCLRW